MGEVRARSDDPAKIDPALQGKKVFTIIWTTTPWTLPASMAVAFHPDEEYVALEAEWRGLHRRRQSWPTTVAEKCGFTRATRAGALPRQEDWSTLTFAHPFLDRRILGVLADYVTMDTGTGVVHTAPSHGADDFATGVKYRLDRPATWTQPASCATDCRNMTARKCSRRTRRSSSC